MGKKKDHNIPDYIMIKSGKHEGSRGYLKMNCEAKSLTTYKAIIFVNTEETEVELLTGEFVFIKELKYNKNIKKKPNNIMMG